MFLTKHLTGGESRWALDGNLLPPDIDLGRLLRLPRADRPGFLRGLASAGQAGGDLLAPIDADQEVWAAGVTYLRSREAREAESSASDVYSNVYRAERPELFFKAPGRRVVGHGMPIRVRADSRWNVPEPELTLVVDSRGEIAGYCAGNDVSSRDIEGENPLYLPQAKVYEGSCALGPAIVLADPDTFRDLRIGCDVRRGEQAVFAGGTRTSQMKRTFEELAGYLFRELAFPAGAFLMTGTGIVPPPDFSLTHGDTVRITIGPLVLENQVDGSPRHS